MTINVAEVKRRLKALLNDENLVNEYIRTYGPTIDIKSIKQIKDKKMRSVRVSDKNSGENPVFKIKICCPVCNQDDITCYELRSKSQSISYNKFMVPIYVGANGYRSMDYTLIYTSVCPRCFFASPDKKDFTRLNLNNGAEIKSQLPSNVIMSLQEKIGKRKAILKSVSDYNTYFALPRTDEAAIHSLRLSMERADVETYHNLPYSYFKLGSAALRIAKIMKDINQNNDEVFKEALHYFEEGFRTSNTPGEEMEMQSIYIIILLYLKIGDKKTANSYIGVLGNIKNQRIAEMKESTSLNTTIIQKWEDKAKFIWEDRNDPDLFKNE